MRLDVEIPDGAEERAWNVVRAAFAERERAPRRRRAWPLVAVAAAAVAVAAAVTSPGRALFGNLRDAVGKQNAAPALFSLPTQGRLIVQSTDGPWIVQRDGSRRLLERYDEASWSPFGKYVAATRGNELYALESDGSVHWSLARPGRITHPRWAGSTKDTRIAYLSGRDLRVVGGDGKGDRLIAKNVAPAPPAWFPFTGTRELAFADRHGVIHLVDPSGHKRFPASPPGPVPTELRFTNDANFLLAIAPRSLRILTSTRKPLRTIPLPAGPHALAVAPYGSNFALTRRSGANRSELLVYDAIHPARPQRLFAATGDFTSVAWSPDGRWILLAWPAADQWLFVPASATGLVLPVARIAEQFSSHGVFPALGDWCCRRG